jgi:hypothetical protein
MIESRIDACLSVNLLLERMEDTTKQTLRWSMENVIGSLKKWAVLVRVKMVVVVASQLEARLTVRIFTVKYCLHVTTLV